MNIPKEDIKFIENKLMPLAGVRKLRLAYDRSKKTYPDIWVEFGDIPTIMITDEWRRQNVHERRKRLTHEFLHLRGMEHGRVGKYVYSTYPKFDTLSMKVYRDLQKISR